MSLQIMSYKYTMYTCIYTCVGQAKCPAIYCIYIYLSGGRVSPVLVVAGELFQHFDVFFSLSLRCIRHNIVELEASFSISSRRK